MLKEAERFYWEYIRQLRTHFRSRVAWNSDEIEHALSLHPTQFDAINDFLLDIRQNKTVVRSDASYIMAIIA